MGISPLTANYEKEKVKVVFPVGILDNVQGHQDLIKLNSKQRIQLCNEIRDFLVSSVSKTGGHVSSNMGVVELTVALETVFDTSVDRLVFDVGHQSYVHKMLTGRQGDFSSLRQFGGMAGFPKPSESDRCVYSGSRIQLCVYCIRYGKSQNSVP